MRLIRRLLSDSFVEKHYVTAGANFGDAASMVHMGECVGFNRFLNKWEKWEEEYAHRGFRTVSLDRFIFLGGYGRNIDDLIGQKRGQNEEPVFHAKIYRRKYLGKIKPVGDFGALMRAEGPQMGTYIPPSTER